MSDLAEYAARLHETEAKRFDRPLVPVSFPSKAEKLVGIQAAIFDVYGTMMNYWRPGFDSSETRLQVLENSFHELALRFGMTETLEKMNPADPPQKTLSEFYHGLIALGHEQAKKRGVDTPEVKIEEIWGVVVLMLKRNGYDPTKYCPGASEDFPRYLAYTYNFLSLGRQLYPGVVDTLIDLKKRNVALGIVSNAQFYTPMDLTLLFRDQSNGAIDDITELFDPDLTFFSYEYGVAKPHELLFRRLYDSLYEYQILPKDTVFVGNDLLIDIKPSHDAGMKTALFTGDTTVLFTGGDDGEIVPDLTFQEWTELGSKISFFEK